VKGVARESLEALPDGVCQTVLSAEAVHPAILSHLAHAFRDREDRAERIALNPAADDATLAFLASLPFRRVVEIVSNNQERMLRAPEIVDALGANPLTGRSVIERILAFVGGDAPGPARGDGEVCDADAEAALRAVLGEELGRFARSLVQESAEAGEKALTGEITNLYALIQKMSVYQKIKLARLGNREARGLLVRDRNKVVAVAAILSPKITDNEIVAIANSRNVDDEVLRIVANNRQWTRSYKVKLALAANPKTPQPLAMGFVSQLHDSDMLSLMKSKDVPSAIATHARRMLTKKGKL
jgi:hypothetical protein